MTAWNAKTMGRKGGQIGGRSTSEPKANAARQNGKTAHVVYIYSLACPETGKVMYVGRTQCPRTRESRHSASPGPRPQPVKTWCMKLRDQGLKPVFNILEETTREKGGARERTWMEQFSASEKLLNVNKAHDASKKDFAVITVNFLHGRDDDTLAHIQDRAVAEKIGASTYLRRLAESDRLRGAK